MHVVALLIIMLLLRYTALTPTPAHGNLCHALLPSPFIDPVLLVG